jgi:hypothetical protein
MTTQDYKASRNMSIDDATVILARKPKGPAEFAVARIAILALKSVGMDAKAIKREIGRKLSFPEELVLAEF